MPLHPTLAERLDMLEGLPPLDGSDLSGEAMSALFEFDRTNDVALPPVGLAEHVIDGQSSPVRVRVYTPPDGAPRTRAGLVWMHGGAFAGGSIDMPEGDRTARQLALRGVVVVNVDYRLAVDGVHFPAPLDDVVTAVRWFAEHAGRWEVDRQRVAVGGASAGANLAAAAALRLRDERSSTPHRLVLAYGAFHATMPTSESVEEKLEELPAILRTVPFEAIMENYLGGPLSTATAYSAPALADLDGLCPSLVLNAEYDPLRASGEAFADSLTSAGVAVHQELVPSVLHGFLNRTDDLEPVKAALDLMAQYV